MYHVEKMGELENLRSYMKRELESLLWRDLENLMREEFGWADDKPPSIYTSLPTPTSIRILKVSKNLGPDNQIICHVKVVDLNSAPKYAALSYTWGDPGADPNDALKPVFSQEPTDGGYEVSCNSYPVMVTKNCAYYLHAARLWKIILKREAQRSRRSESDDEAIIDYIWIDAICINQASLEERSSQVRLMDRIYRQAQKVLVWLGPADSMTEPAVKAITTIAGASVEVCGRLRGSRILDPEAYKTLGISSINEQEWLSMRALCQRSWFSRAWTTQEYALARKAFMLCGHAFVELRGVFLAVQNMALLGWNSQLELLGTAVDVPGHTAVRGLPLDAFLLAGSPEPEEARYLQLSAQLAGPRPGMSANDSDVHGATGKDGIVIALLNLSFLEQIQGRVSRERWLAHEDTFPLQAVLLATRDRICSNPADRLYAVLGLVPEASWRDLPIDYAMPTIELYTRAAYTLIRSSQSLSILSLVGEKSLRTYKDLPSWIPDFTSPNVEMPLDMGCSTDILIPGRRLVNFNASRGMHFHVEVQDTRSATLQVQGIYVDTVQAWAEFEFAALHLLEPLLDVITKLPRDQLWRAILANEHVYNLDHGSKDISGSNSARANDGETFVYLLSILTWSMLQEVALKLPFRPPGGFQEANAVEIARQQYDVYEKIVDSELILIPRSLLVIGEIPPFIDRPQYSYPPDTLRSMAEALHSAVTARMLRRVLFTTRKEKVGSGPRSVQEGDEVWVLAGAKVPYILRPVGNAQYELVGEAYMHDIMHGELVKEGKGEISDITLV
ncbi:heterokaryon incompatibility protein-domain-containing protein [Lophiotrema nucula]|uniref:Heterokaryon incompatibility protein-domain-containing protein n=1 Tax=Lophiotrema nucula TaxID=690887 RepID=A0A6A5YZ41_9PLEO|nr:heterokaryon incompatibility protein-domain-containing protein [Lophiotrema nucula]